GAGGEGVKERDRARPDRDHIPEDASGPCRRTLVRLDGAGMVVRLDLEDDRPTLADLHGPCVLARALQDAWARGRKLTQERLRGLVRAVLGPEHTEHAELDTAGLAAQLVDDLHVLVGRQRDLRELATVDQYRLHRSVTEEAV